MISLCNTELALDPVNRLVVGAADVVYIVVGVFSVCVCAELAHPMSGQQPTAGVQTAEGAHGYTGENTHTYTHTHTHTHCLSRAGTEIRNGARQDSDSSH